MFLTDIVFLIEIVISFSQDCLRRGRLRPRSRVQEELGADPDLGSAATTGQGQTSGLPRPAGQVAPADLQFHESFGLNREDQFKSDIFFILIVLVNRLNNGTIYQLMTGRKYTI